MRLNGKVCFRRVCLAAMFVFLYGLAAGRDVPYGVGTWEVRELGNHRVVVSVSKPVDAASVHIPWRRRDHDPHKKNIIVVDADTGHRIKNVWRVEVNREFGEIIFEPVSGAGIYYVYYMPHIRTGTHYPKVTYPEPEDSCESSWLGRHGLAKGSLSKAARDQLPKAKVVEIQSINSLSSFYPMEVIATSDEVKELLSTSAGSSYLLFAEDRKYPIRMTDDLPMRWIEKGPSDSFSGDAQRGEFYAFQIGLYAAGKTIDDVDIKFGDLQGPNGVRIASAAMRCFNTGGVSWDGKEFGKVCRVEKGKVQALWCGVQVSQDTHPGKYEGIITVAPKEAEARKIKLVLNVKEGVLADGGDSQPWRHSRLRWLDSKIAIDDEIVAPFTPLRLEGNTISCLGRSVMIGDDGLVESIQSRFSPEVTHVVEQGRQVLSAPIQLVVEDTSGKALAWRAGGIKITKKTDGVIGWYAKSSAGDVTIECAGKMEFDGFCEFKVTLSASKTTEVNDVRLVIPMVKDVARYMMGMGVKGGRRPAEYRWKWDKEKNHDAAWVGDVNAGLQCSFRDENYSRPLNTNFYLLKPLKMPPSWYNDGRGGCDFAEVGDAFVIKAYSGRRSIKPGEKLHFNFNLLLTPFKTLDTAGQWSTRFYHHYESVKTVAKLGANTINNHHATEINPYINYPFLRVDRMKDYVDAAHKLGLKVKIYYTVRELANRAFELFALRSLGDEILSYGPGGGHSWLQEHLGGNYIAGWYVDRYEDAAIINSGVSRWHNYYLEGLNWLVENVGIDGVYIDDVAFDRTVMKRLRKILDRGNAGALIDLHSANQYNRRDGFVNSANLYLEHFPYINRLWFGEYFEYELGPDYWMVEVSGIPFGLMGEMLQDGGNPWRGMVYGMTARMPREEMPRRLWKVWDEFGIADSEMYGYWSANCPVRTGREDVLATAYVRDGSALVSVASWAVERVDCRLTVDWQAIGIDATTAKLSAPAIEGFQTEAVFGAADTIPVEPGRGWLFILR